jgi:hypothetical protein
MKFSPHMSVRQLTFNSQSSEMETESEDEHIENTEVISPSVTQLMVSVNFPLLYNPLVNLFVYIHIQ